MAAGFGLLGLSPAAFWSMTPRELTAAIKGRSGVFGGHGGLPARSDLAALMRRYPD